MIKQHRSRVAFLISLSLHLSLAGTFFWSINQKNESANGFQANVISTHISMEMLAASVINEPEPEPESATQVKQSNLAKEEVADPTVKPEPKKVEKLKEPEKPKETPKKKSKDKPKEKQKKKAQEQNKDLPKSDVQVNSDFSVNQQATTTGITTSNNPNLVGKGSDTSEIQAYLSKLISKIQKRATNDYNKNQQAQAMRKQGKVVVMVDINSAGEISNVRIMKSADNILDNIALKAVSSIGSQGHTPPGFGNQISIPIKFKIK